MRSTFLFILVILSVSSCTYERIYVDDVEMMLTNQLKNNTIEIGRIRNELQKLQIETIDRNINLMARMEILHTDVLLFLDSLDRLARDQRILRTRDFIRTHFDNSDAPARIQLEISDDMPPSLIKLHLAALEGFYISEQGRRYTYEEYPIILDNVEAVIIPEKRICKNGESLRGKVLLMATASDDAHRKNARYIKTIMLNEQPLDDDGKFEMKLKLPPVKKTKSKTKSKIQPVTLTEIKLRAAVMLPDTVLVTETTVYVK